MGVRGCWAGLLLTVANEGTASCLPEAARVVHREPRSAAACCWFLRPGRELRESGVACPSDLEARCALSSGRQQRSVLARGPGAPPLSSREPGASCGPLGAADSGAGLTPEPLGKATSPPSSRASFATELEETRTPQLLRQPFYLSLGALGAPNRSVVGAQLPTQLLWG